MVLDSFELHFSRFEGFREGLGASGGAVGSPWAPGCPQPGFRERKARSSDLPWPPKMDSIWHEISCCFLALFSDHFLLVFWAQNGSPGQRFSMQKSIKNAIEFQNGFWKGFGFILGWFFDDFLNHFWWLFWSMSWRPDPTKPSALCSKSRVRAFGGASKTHCKNH